MNKFYVKKLLSTCLGGGRGRNEPNWGVAYCESVAEKRPAAFDIVAYKNLPTDCIEVLSVAEISKKFVTLQGRTTKWDKLLESAASSTHSAEDVRQFQALLLVQILESLLIASEIWPVEIYSFEETEHGNTLQLKFRKDEEREKLAQALGLRTTAARMREAFGGEQLQGEEEWKWKLTDVGVLGEREGEKNEWTFIEAIEAAASGVTYSFEGSGVRPLGDRLFLRRSSYVGTDKLLNRRANALLALRDHSELLNALRDAGEVVRPYCLAGLFNDRPVKL